MEKSLTQALTFLLFLTHCVIFQASQVAADKEKLSSEFTYSLFNSASLTPNARDPKHPGEAMELNEIIGRLGLQPLPEEGGYFRETYRSSLTLPGSELNGPRALGTAIYYLVTPAGFSALHRLRFDEIFHFYCGDPVEMVQIDDRAKVRRITLGSDLLAGHSFQAVVPAGVWQGTRLIDGGNWALMGTTMAPGFDFEDFELGCRSDLLARFPFAKDAIIKLTREA